MSKLIIKMHSIQRRAHHYYHTAVRY